MRKKYIDLLRELALFYMFFQHGVLALLKYNENQGIIYFLYEIVPFCPALYLFLSGYSLSISYNKINMKELKKQFVLNHIKKGILLIFGSMILFIIEYGFQLPDLIIAPGILNTIGLMIIASVLILIFPYKKIILSILITSLIIITLILEIKQIFVIPFNYGYEAISPTIIFGFIGLLTGLYMNDINSNRRNFRIFMYTLFSAGVFVFIYFSIKYGPFKVFFQDIGRYRIQRIFNESKFLTNIFSKNPNTSTIVAYVWNYTIENFVASLSMVFILFTTGHYIENIFQKYLPENIFVPGKHALFNYFYHLIIIGILVIFVGYNLFSKSMFIVFLLCLFISSYVFSYFIEVFRKRIKKA